MASLQQIREKLLQQEANKKSGSFGDNASYQFWNIPDNSTATIRFLPDGDTENVFFWVEKLNIKMKFQGVVGEHDRETTISVPCVEMFGDSCPILAEIRPWWKDPAKESLARQYWKKRSYLFQGFVTNSPLVEEAAPANPIRRFAINPSIYEIISKSLTNPEMEDNPTDYDGGRDFKLTKTKKPGPQDAFASYTTSQWSFKTRSLSQDERAAVEEHNLFNLSDFRGQRPDAEGVAVIVAMFHDSLAGRPFDLPSYGAYYRPYGLTAPAATTNGDSAEGKVVHLESKAVDRDEPVKEAKESAPTTKPNAHEILERIKNRTNQK